MKHAETVRRIIRDAQMVAHFATRFDWSHAVEIITYTDEPELLCEPGEAPPRYHPCAVAAARLIVESPACCS